MPVQIQERREEEEAEVAGLRGGIRQSIGSSREGLDGTDGWMDEIKNGQLNHVTAKSLCGK